MPTLVFKFRDDIRISPNTPWASLLALPDQFHRRSTRIYDTLKTASTNSGSLLEAAVNRALSVLLRQVIELTNLTPRPVYGDATLRSLTQLADRIEAYKPVARHGQQPPRPSLPNLLNYFQIELPDTVKESVLDLLLGLFGKFLTPKRFPLGIELPPLFEFVYIKGDPIALAGEQPTNVPNANANQAYLTDIGLLGPSPAPQAVNGPRLGLTILEANGWHLTHKQFDNFKKNNSKGNVLQVVTYGDVPFDATKLPVDIGKLEHGTQILGMLIANNTDADISPPATDLCRGMLPQTNVTIRLVSCLTGESVVDAQGRLLTARYNEAAALLAAIVATPSGEAILIELGTGSANFPLDTQPAVYELLTYADYLDITVIEAAGNGGNILDTVPGGQPPLLPPRNLITSVQADHSASFWTTYLNNDAGRAQLEQLVEEYVGNDNAAGTRPKAPKPFTSARQFLKHYNQTPSPAILIGSARRVAAGQFSVLPASNKGNRVKVFAQGHDILTTTSPGFVNDPTCFVGSMSDTSGAAAIIAGLVVLVQWEARQRAIPVLSPPDIAAWLAEMPGIGSFLAAGNSLMGVVPSYTNVVSHLG